MKWIGVRRKEGEEDREPDACCPFGRRGRRKGKNGKGAHCR